MDFDGAILAHTRWKRRLQASMNGGERLDPAVVHSTNQCDLGKWLHGEGSARSDADFEKLVRSHAAFHEAAAAVVERINRGQVDEAARMIGLGSAFVDRSRRRPEADARPGRPPPDRADHRDEHRAGIPGQ